MILAAADYGEEPSGEPPPELGLALSCHRWNSLPEAGGLLDQPAGLMRRLAIVENIYNTFKALKASNNYAEFGDKNPGAVKLIEEITRMRAENDKVASMSATGGEHGG